MALLGHVLSAMQSQVLGRHNQICHLSHANIAASVPSGSLLPISSNGGRELLWGVATVKMLSAFLLM